MIHLWEVYEENFRSLLKLTLNFLKRSNCFKKIKFASIFKKASLYFFQLLKNQNPVLDPGKIATQNSNWTKKLLVWPEIGEAAEATITAEVTIITITVEVTAETKAKVDSIVEVVVVANTAVDTKTTAEAVKEVN